MSNVCLTKLLELGKEFNGDINVVADDVCNFINNGGQFVFSYKNVTNKEPYIRLTKNRDIAFALIYKNTNGKFSILMAFTIFMKHLW